MHGRDACDLCVERGDQADCAGPDGGACHLCHFRQAKCSKKDDEHRAYWRASGVEVNDAVRPGRYAPTILRPSVITKRDSRLKNERLQLSYIPNPGVLPRVALSSRTKRARSLSSSPPASPPAEFHTEDREVPWNLRSASAHAAPVPVPSLSNFPLMGGTPESEYAGRRELSVESERDAESPLTLADALGDDAYWLNYLHNASISPPPPNSNSGPVPRLATPSRSPSPVPSLEMSSPPRVPSIRLPSLPPVESVSTSAPKVASGNGEERRKKKPRYRKSTGSSEPAPPSSAGPPAVAPAEVPVPAVTGRQAKNRRKRLRQKEKKRALKEAGPQV